jgi:hypothetical protein
LRVTAKAKMEVLRRKAARNSLLDFTTYTKPDYQVAHMHRLICDKLEAVERGEIKRLMIFTPPRHGKSELVSKRFPAWYLMRNPDRQIISASYGSDLAGDFARDVRNIVASPEYALLSPGVSLATDSGAKERWHTNQGGSYVSAGVGSAITGRGAHILNIDDPVKGRAEAESEVVRESVYNWYTSTAYTRLMPGGAVILTMTRWHEDDLAGRLLLQMQNGGDQWDILTLPAFDEHQNALWPERYSAQDLNNIRAAIGPRDFESLYMQNPKPDGATFFDVRNVLTDGLPVEHPPYCDGVFAVIDTAVKTGSKNDGTAVTYWLLRKTDPTPLILLDWDILQIEGASLEVWLPTVFQNLEALSRKHSAVYGTLGAYIEDKASGTILLQQSLRRGWQAHAIDSKLTAMGKDERAISVSGYVYRGMVKMSKSSYEKVTVYKGQSANHLLKQVFGFRLGVKDQQDDLLDTFCYSIAIALGNNEGF